MSACTICSGTLHVRMGDGRWVPCVCAVEEEKRKMIDDAGLDQLFMEDLWDRVTGPHAIIEYLKSLDLDPTGIAILVGGDIQLRWSVAAYVLAGAPRHLEIISLSALVDRRFRDQRGKEEAARRSNRVRSLWVRCDFPSRHSWNESTLNDALAERSGKLTIVTMQDKWIPIHVPSTEVPMGEMQWRT